MPSNQIQKTQAKELFLKLLTTLSTIELSMSETEIDEELQRLGYDPQQIEDKAGAFLAGFNQPE